MTRFISDLFKKPPPQAPAYLIVGLGNPGRQHRANRHNVGFMLLDKLAERLDVNFARLESKALVTKARYKEDRLVLAKPQTFMNLSGQAVSSLVRYYKIPFENLLISSDDVDLDLGSLRLRPDGGSGGQKGLASIIKELGTQEFPRLRLGIGRPPGRMEAAAYVLQDFAPGESETLSIVLDRGAEAALTFVSQGIESAMNRYNGSITGE